MNIAPDAWSADTEALHARIARLEAQSEVRRLQTLYWQERAQDAELREDQLLIRNKNLLAALDVSPD